MSKRAVILAGGKGSRLRPYTVVLPKPLMPIGQFPILEVVVRQLVDSGFDHITMAVNHQADIIKAYFNSGGNWGITIDYSLEKEPLGTMGPLKLIADLPEHFLVMNGDILTDLDYAAMYRHHIFSGNTLTISAFQRELRSEFGVLEVDDFDTLCGFKEKPVTKHVVSMGVYMLTREVLGFIPEGQEYGFDHLMSDMMEAKEPIHVRKHDGYWLDIGRPDDYIQAIDMFEENSELFLGGHHVARAAV